MTEAAAAVLFGDGDGHPAQARHALPDFLRVKLVAIENAAGHGEGRFIVEKALRLLTNQVLLFRKLEIHGWMPEK